jgi:pimeloyl-ACP methyl ester carboxylesterase
MGASAMEVVSADGFRIPVTEQGHGRPILIVHGGGGLSASWARVAGHLATRFRVLRFDRRTYRRPGGAEPTATMENEANDVLAVAAAAGEPAVMVGHSSGAVVTLEAALASPGQFAGMVLYEPPVAVTEPLGGDALVRAKAALAAGDPGRALQIHLREIVRAPGLLVRLLPLVGPLWRQVTMFAPGQLADDVNLESLGVGIRRYAALNVPALLLGGARSPKHLSARLNALAAVLPNVDSVVILPRQGHQANEWTPGKVAHVIEPFADRVLR